MGTFKKRLDKEEAERKMDRERSIYLHYQTR